MANPIENKHILLGVTGSIACYKAADLASKLAQAGAQVDVILTGSALQFITPLTFQSVTGRRAYTDSDLWGDAGHVLHVGLGHSVNLVAVAPATANTLAKMAHGLADNLLTVTALAAHCPVLVAPAMDGGMFSHPATQASLETLKGRGVAVVGPAEGHLASGLLGVGRMIEPAEIFGHIRWLLGRSGPLKGRRVIVTAGGTQEPIDPVRVIANRSSGKQGYALAQAALDLGAEVILISAQTNLMAPVGAHYQGVGTAQEMLESVLAALPQADALIMAAAVADFRPADPARDKIKKGGGIPEIRLENTPDILHAVAERKTRSGFPRVTVGFAAESQDLLENARAKLQSKRLDLIAANDISALDAGFAVETNRVALLSADGGQESLPLMSKEGVAQAVLERVVELLQGSGKNKFRSEAGESKSE
jgi:phosphopantothenoylcysteine decarboxylase/phosphopantothenate--cysteine ligase